MSFNSNRIVESSSVKLNGKRCPYCLVLLALVKIIIPLWEIQGSMVVVLINDYLKRDPCDHDIPKR